MTARFPDQSSLDPQPIGLLLAACLFLAACANGHDNSVSPPRLNPNPVERVRLTVIAPSTLSVRLVASYQIGTWVFAYAGGTYCGPKEYPAHTPLPTRTRTIPINLKWDGNSYTGEFLIDRFLPGRCRWGFSSLDMVSPAKTFLSRYEERAIQYNFDTTHSNGLYDQSPAQQTDLWCGADPGPPSEHGRMLCTSLDYFAIYPGAVANELLAKVPVNLRARTPEVNILPSTRSITLRYHDLAAENHAAISSPVAGLPKKCPRAAVRLYIDQGGVVTVNGVQVTPQTLPQYLRRLKPAPKLACYSVAGTTGRPLGSAMQVIVTVSQLDLPLEVYTDHTFATPVTLKRQAFY